MPIKYVPFVPEPVEGQAVLQNFNRVLKYKGSDETNMLLKRGMPLYDVSEVEKVGDADTENLVLRGECVSACAYLKENNIKVDLVYIDPPFASGADYAKKIYLRKNPKVSNAIKQAEKDLSDDEFKAFEEKMYGDVWDKEKYLNWMYENLQSIKSVMSEASSLYVHLDHHIGHYVKILLDEVFGEENFINEIIWQYYMGGKGTKEFAKKHDTIYLYAKNKNEYVFNKLIVKRYYDFVPSLKDESSNAETGKDEIGYFGMVSCPDVWSIKGVFNMSNEYCNYNTQKPEQLLRRAIEASSKEDMIIADFFGGSGVTAKVANDLNRKFIHCDVGINSIHTVRDRLISNDANFKILDIKDGIQLFRNPVQTMEKLKTLIPGLKNEDSLDSFWEGYINDSKYGRIPVYLPNLMDSSTKVLNTYLINQVIHEAIPDLDSNIKKVIVYYVDIQDEEKIYKFINDDKSTNIEIELKDLKEILDDVVIEDFVQFHTKEEHISIDENFCIEITNFKSDRVQSKIEAFNEKGVLNDKKGTFKPIEISNEGLELIEFLSVDCTNEEGPWHSDSEIKIDEKGLVAKNGSKTKDFWDGKIRCPQAPKRLKIRNICGDETIWKVNNEK